jgi:tetratricopeptide (TPR) repeat protein
MKRRIWFFVGGGIALWAIVFIISLAAFPEWRDGSGSVLQLMAVSAVGVAGFVGVVVGIAAAFGYFKEKPEDVKEADPTGVVKAQLILDAKLEEFDEARQKELVAVLAVLLHTSKDQVKILRVTRGSVIVELELPGAAYDRLEALAHSGDASLAKAGILRVIGPGGNTLTRQAKYPDYSPTSLDGLQIIGSSGGFKTPEMIELEKRQELEKLEKRLELARHTNNRYGEALTLRDLAFAYAARGERERAIGLLRQALDIYIALGSPHADEIRRQLKVWGMET